MFRLIFFFFMKRPTIKAMCEVCFRFRIIFFQLVSSFGLISLTATSLCSEDLFNGSNPYVQKEEIRVGDVIKLVVDEPVIVEYDYEGDRDDHRTIKLAPDRQTLSFLPPVDDDRSYVDKNRSKIRSRVRLRMHFGVRVAAIENGIIRFQGTRRLGYEQGRLEQQMQSSGFVSLRDIGRDRSVLSRNVADLQIVIIGRPQEQRENLQLKQEPPANPADPPVIRADMTDSEKQRLLLDYLNRLLGETGTVLP